MESPIRGWYRVVRAEEEGTKEHEAKCEDAVSRKKSYRLRLFGPIEYASAGQIIHRIE